MGRVNVLLVVKSRLINNLKLLEDSFESALSANKEAKIKQCNHEYHGESYAS